jgi:ribosomal protein S18 acetylase RimI-like enzyme
MTGKIRKASREEIGLLLDWAAAEGWNPGIEDASPFWAADPDGYWLTEEAGEPVAAISLVGFGTDYAFLGFYLVRPDLRGKGYGWALWQEAMASAGSRLVGLDGVVAQQDNYRKSGFERAHANRRYSGRVSVRKPSDERLVAVSPIHVPQIVAYDAALNPAARERFLGDWLKTTETRRSMALMRNGTVRGYGTIRECRSGFKIGPLFSDSDTGADLLFRALVADVGGGEVSLDVPVPNDAAKALCTRHDLAPIFETARMYRGPVPDLPLSRIYGITSFELG